MPELAEVRLMADFINGHLGPFQKTFRSQLTKITVPDLRAGILISAKSRGKELLLEFDSKKILFTMGMTGNWQKFPTEYEVNKHAHFNILLKSGSVLSMVDPRRFARWKFVDDFSIDRSPDLTDESFSKFILGLLGCAAFDKPAYEVMMDQRFFNGMGNYLRAEVLYRLNVDPFQSLNDLLERHSQKFLELCKSVPLEAYHLGGGEFLTFKNPNSNQEMNKGDWMQCYGKKGMVKILDAKNRNFWYNPKWKVDV